MIKSSIPHRTNGFIGKKTSIHLKSCKNQSWRGTTTMHTHSSQSISFAVLSSAIRHPLENLDFNWKPHVFVPFFMKIHVDDVLFPTNNAEDTLSAARRSRALFNPRNSSMACSISASAACLISTFCFASSEGGESSSFSDCPSKTPRKWFPKRTFSTDVDES